MKKIPKRYRKQQPTAGLMGMQFKWMDKEWVVTGYDAIHAFILSGTLKSQIELRLLPTVAENIRAA